MRRNCLNCHFLTKESRGENGATYNFPLNDNDRESLRNEPISFDRGWYAFKCYMGVWDEGVSPVAKEDDTVVFSKERDDDCFFIKYQPSMLFPAAVELQKRNQENKKLKTSYRYTLIGLWLAGIGLILNALAVIFKLK